MRSDTLDQPVFYIEMRENSLTGRKWVSRTDTVSLLADLSTPDALTFGTCFGIDLSEIESVGCLAADGVHRAEVLQMTSVAALHTHMESELARVGKMPSVAVVTQRPELQKGQHITASHVTRSDLTW